MTTRELIAGIDAGGTSFKVGVGTPDGELLGTDRIMTGSPDATIAGTIQALQRLANAHGGTIARLGIASFGPVDVAPHSPTYGSILATPKPGWRHIPLLPDLCAALDCAGHLDTDVNGALEAEMRNGAAAGTDRAAYVTIGTGVGVGIRTGDRFAARPFHPELGHIRVDRHDADEGCVGGCAFHGECLEGLVSAPSLSARFGPLEALSTDHPAWTIAGHYLAQLAVTLVLGFRVERIVFGGGVSNAAALVPNIRTAYRTLMNGYVDDVPAETLIVRAAHGDLAGLIGGTLIACRPDV